MKMEPRNRAFIDWKSGMKYQAIADKYGVALSTVKSWAARDWKLREVATKSEKKLQSNAERFQPQKQTQPEPGPVAGVIEESGNITDKQRLFCQYYVGSYNATQAAIKAGYSRDTAGQIGYQLLQKTSIQKEIQRLKGDVNEAALTDLPDVIRELSSVAFDDIGNYLDFRTERTQIGTDDEGNPLYDYKPVVELRDSRTIDTRNISEISVGDKGQLKVKLYSRDTALYKLAEIGLKIKSMEISLLKLEAGLPPTNDESSSPESNFADALKGTASEVWGDHDDQE